MELLSIKEQRERDEVAAKITAVWEAKTPAQKIEARMARKRKVRASKAKHKKAKEEENK